MKRFFLLVIAVAIGFGIAGCANLLGVNQMQDSTQAGQGLGPEVETPPEAVEAGPVAPPLTIPECDDLVDLMQVPGDLAGKWQVWETSDQTLARQAEAMGPAARDTLDASDQQLSCLFAVPNTDVSFEALVVELDTAAREVLIASLRASDYVESELAFQAPKFRYEVAATPSNIPVTYVFSGSAWIVSGSDHTGEIVELVLRGMQEANPGLP